MTVPIGNVSKLGGETTTFAPPLYLRTAEGEWRRTLQSSPATTVAIQEEQPQVPRLRHRIAFANSRFSEEKNILIGTLD
jgi:hypothetical protein